MSKPSDNSKQSRRNFRKVRLFRKSDQISDRGIPNGDWKFVRYVYAYAVPKSSQEATRDNTLGGITLWSVELRHAAGLSYKDRIEWQGRMLEFNGTPYNPEIRCRKLLVDAVECEPCQTK